MQIKVKVRCDICDGSGTCGGSGYVRWMDHQGITREVRHIACEGTGWVEEWRDMETTTLREYLMLLRHDQELIAIHECLRATVERMDGQTERIKRLEQFVDDLLIKCALMEGRSAKTLERVERLEQIVLTLAAGSESSSGGSGDFPDHTHWVYPIRESRDLVEEIKNVIERQTDA